MADKERNGSSEWVQRVLILAVAALLCALLTVNYSRAPKLTLREGEVAEQTVRAPMQFSYTDRAALEQARKRAADGAPQVYLYDDKSLVNQRRRLSEAFNAGRTALGEEEERSPELLKNLALAFAQDLGSNVFLEHTRVLASQGFPEEAEAAIARWIDAAHGESFVVDSRQLPKGGNPVMLVPDAGQGEPYILDEVDRIITLEQLRRRITRQALSENLPDSWVSAAEQVALGMASADTFFDPDRTKVRLEEAKASVVAEPILIQRGETLFTQGQRITARHVAMYSALQRNRADSGIAARLFSTGMLIFLVLVSLYTTSRGRFPPGKEGRRDLVSLGALLVVVAALGRLIVSASPGIASILGTNVTPKVVWFLLPMAGAVMLARLLMDVPRTVFLIVSATVVTALMMDLNAAYAVYFLLVSGVAMVAIVGSRERIGVVKAGLVTGLYGAGIALLLYFVDLYSGGHLVTLGQAISPIWSMLFALAGGLLSGFIVLGLLPLFESAGYVTDYRMMELASLNHPVMRQLMLRAPGTYHHSVVVGSLAEAACEAIGANGTEAKISAYFHDIGKSLKPRYFVENQRGGHNRHNDLHPRASAEIIISHVTEGARIAREHKLPQPILDNILMHHGTGLLQYFYAKAQMMADDPSQVDADDFRYPGPKPNTREAGVVMLADKVEAATRTIRQPTEDNIRAMIHRIINSVMADNQFSECPLTFKEIHQIAEAFVQVLTGIYHQRIEYAETKELSRGEAKAEITDDHTEPQVFQFPDVGFQEEWEEEPQDEATDYESVRNLPHGDN